MAEPNSPAAGASGDRRAADESVADESGTSRSVTSPSVTSETPASGSGASETAEPQLLAPPTEEELSGAGEPTLEEIRAAAAGDPETSGREGADIGTGRPAAVAVEPGADGRTDGSTDATPARPTEERVAAQQSAPPAPAQQQPVLAPAEELAPPPPRRRSNRLVGAAWVLLAAGLFEVLFFAVNALVVLVFASPAAVASQLQQIAGTPLAWLPVVLFFLLFLLAVLVLNRAGRVAYVLASLIVGVIVYIATALLFSLIERHTLGDSNTLAQTFLNWEFILIGLAAREVMLWTGLAIGSRGIRVRRRNKEERARYDEELADA